MTKRDQAPRSAADKPNGSGWSLSHPVKSGKHRVPAAFEGWSAKKHLVGDEPPVSPGTVEPQGPDYFKASPEPPAKDRSPVTAPFQNYRQELAAADSPNIPSISRDPPSAPLAQIAPWAADSSAMPSTARLPPTGHFFDDGNDGLHPGHRPSTSRTDTSESFDGPWNGDDRRPSIASSTTVGSQSSGDRSKMRKLTGIFGADDRSGGAGGQQQPPYSEKTPAASSASLLRTRTNSYQKREDGRPRTPSSSRPLTPLPSSDVVPWVFQDPKDIHQYGNAPVRQTPTGLDKPRFENETTSSTGGGHSHRFHLPGHRHTRSKDGAKPSPRDPTNGYSPRPMTGKEDSPGAYRRGTEFIPPSTPMTAHGQLSARATSPFPSGNRLASERSPMEPPTPGKRSLMDKLRGRDKGGKNSESLRNMPGSQRSLNEPTSAKFVKLDPWPPKKGRDASIATFDSGSTIKASDSNQSEQTSKKESKSSKLLHGHGKFPTPSRGRFVQDHERRRDGPKTNESYWNLDTDLNNMEGIVSTPLLDTPQTGGPMSGMPLTGDESNREPWDSASTTGPGAWDAPESWAVKKVGDENMAYLREIDEEGIVPKSEDTGISHGLRVFRIDSTFATILTGVNTTSAEILQILGKKSFLQDDLNTYQIIMKKSDLQRQLAPGERPVAIQRRLLEQAGYLPSDHTEEVGREDNSYLVRFTFVPTKISGYYTLERDSGLDKMNKFNNIDLSGRSLVTIPILLYKKAAEIITLNLSRNLALDVPTDFIQGCIHLREIKYTGNEAWQLPTSFSLASRLTVLDISNNRLEQLDHAHLDELRNLVSIKVSNNRLTALPPCFAAIKSLRSLNISSNYFKELPDFLYDSGLVDLDISFNAIEALPRLGQLKTLERLWATNNQLAGPFPNNLKNLVNLKEIDVRFNAISDMDIISELPMLEHLMIGHNAISRFEGSFERIRILHADHNPITRFNIKASVPTLSSLNLASAKISQLDDSLFERVSNLTKLNLNKNHFTTLSPQLGRLTRLEYLSVAKTSLTTLPASIGCLTELRFLDAHECNILKLPSELWLCNKLDTLNLSSNVLEVFPKLTPTLQHPSMESQSMSSLSTHSQSNTVPPSPNEEIGKLEEFGHRRPSQSSGKLLGLGSSPVESARKGSIVSVQGPGGRKSSVMSRTPTNDGVSPLARKDSNIASRLTSTFAGSLRFLSLADNRLGDDIFDMICLLPELRILNLAYNFIDDIPQNAFRRWPHLHGLYLSGNSLTSLPSDDLAGMENHPLKALFLNGNKFQVLPAELGKVKKIAVLDIGSNSLKYNVSNWRYDWNWNFNKNLKYLNFSGNKRLEIRQQANSNSIIGAGSEENNELTNFTKLQHLRVLGLMDVTLTIDPVPEETDDRRIRTSGTVAGSMTYGMADSLGRQEHLSTIDLLVPRFRGHDGESVLGLFDGQSMSSGGSKVAKFLHENFGSYFTKELSRIKGSETACDALRRTFLNLNKELATTAMQTMDEKDHRLPKMTKRGSTAQVLNAEDVQSGGVATVLYLDNMDLYVANVGDAQAMLMHSNGGHAMLTESHDPANPEERQRIREAGGYVSRHGKLNDVLEVSRAFGYIHHMPAVMASPHVQKFTLTESDEMVLIASKELWEYLTPDVVVDVARSERGDVMRAAQKLRDLAISFGALGKIMVMLISVADLKKRERSRNRGNTLSLGPSSMPDDPLIGKRGKHRRDGPDDSTLARLDKEVEAPIEELSLVFTDIKSSTALWELFPVAMRTAIKIHNDLLRRQLRIIGGYEVKTEGDAFMVAFPTATSALLWAFSVQQQLLKAPWPTEILNSVHGQEILDNDQNVIYKGLSVRMGMHWGKPVCEPDPVTKRMDYFGPMVNRAARISSVADGGQITVSQDFITEIQRTLETYTESERGGSVGSEDAMLDDATAQAIRRDLRALSTQGFEVKDLGERKLKGLENPEVIYLMYPYMLSARLNVQPTVDGADKDAAAARPASLASDSQLAIDPQHVWDLWNVSLRLEMLCSTLEVSGREALQVPETGMLERMKDRGGQVSDRFLVQFVEHLVSRVETCITTLQVRNLIRPFVASQSLLGQAAPMGELLADLVGQLAELKAYRDDAERSFGQA